MVTQPVEHGVDRELGQARPAAAAAAGRTRAGGGVERVDEVAPPRALAPAAERAVDEGPVDDVPGLEQHALDGEHGRVRGHDGEAVRC